MSSIIVSEMKIYKSLVVSDTSTNGGLMSAVESVSGVVNNIWPHVFKSERTVGSTTYRKFFLKIANDTDNTLFNPLIWLDRPTEGDDYVVLFAGTQSDTQGTWPTGDTADKYGVGVLNTAITGGVTSTIIVDVPEGMEMGGADPIFRDAGTIRISDMLNPDSVTGNEETAVISGTPTNGSPTGTTPFRTYPVTIVLTAAVANSYTTTDTRVMSVYEPSDVKCTTDNWVETSTSGTFDEGTYPVVNDNIGTIDQEVTLTFTDATNFTATSNRSGITLGSGTTGGDFAPNNPDFTKPYFTLPSAGWAGTWASGETIVFQTHPAAVAMWEKRVIPALTPSITNNRVVHTSTGEAA